MTLPELPTHYPEPCPTCGADLDPAGFPFGPEHGLLCGDCALRRDAAREHERQHPAPPADDHFGTCPECGGHDGYLNAGSAHWFICHEHRVRWAAGSGLFSSWRDESEAEQRHAYEVSPGWGHYREVAT